MIEILNLGLSTLVIYLLVEEFLLDAHLAKVISMGSVVCWNFLFYKFFVYT